MIGNMSMANGCGIFMAMIVRNFFKINIFLNVNIFTNPIDFPLRRSVLRVNECFKYSIQESDAVKQQDMQD